MAIIHDVCVGVKFGRCCPCFIVVERSPDRHTKLRAIATLPKEVVLM
ncbi:MAG: hypothetical protein LH628_18345 [Microcoleus sp. CAN_BIN18]|nr:hypothetical protein [Microcoleus sp. CAN_BIN18]